MYKSGSTACHSMIHEYSNYVFFAPTKISNCVFFAPTKITKEREKESSMIGKKGRTPIRMIIRIQYLLNHGAISGSI